MDLLAGTSGYSYKEWLGSFYPETIGGDAMLAHYATKLPAVEINSTFYQLPRKETLKSWADQVPGSFRFAIKASRRITHLKRLKGASEEVAYLLGALEILGERLGAILFQLPPNLKKDTARLDAFLDLLPGGTPAAFEFRHPSWLDEETLERLRARGFPVCAADTEEEAVTDPVDTARWGYLRCRRSGYTPERLKRLVRMIEKREWERAFVFFKHEEGSEGAEAAARFLSIGSKPRRRGRGAPRRRPDD